MHSATSDDAAVSDTGGTGGGQSSPAPSLPKGGGAIRGIGEKFAANPVTGTASLQVPIETSRGRGDFGPKLSLSYDSGNGNGPFGFGWRLSLPAITRKTDKGLPRYADHEQSDVFVLAGAEDLVPAFVLDEDGELVTDASGDPLLDEDDIEGHDVLRFRPRVEGLFARIERWIDRESGSAHWRSISTDNQLTVFGRDAASQIRDPEDPDRIFSWLICETRDDKGNAVIYEYKPEDGAGVDLTQAHERHRGPADDPRRTAGRQLKRVRYGNRAPLLDGAGRRPHDVPATALAQARWLFEVVLDYGEHDADDPHPSDDPAVGNSVPWPPRTDPFSTYVAGFEVRTTRLCRRILMFHHFPGEAGVGADCLVASTDLAYRESPIGSFVTAITHCGYRRATAGGYLRRTLPPLELEYSRPEIDETVRELADADLENLPAGVDGTSYRWVDLDGEGLTGVLTEQAGAWFYKRNLGDARFGPLEPVPRQPSLAGGRLVDLDGDGRLDLVRYDGPSPGFHERTDDGDWQPFRPFEQLPTISWDDPNLRFVDLDGDGHADALLTADGTVTWYQSLAERGFGAARRVAGPRVVFADGEQSVHLADMSGDGRTDLVRIRNGDVSYWPNLGHGRFGAQVRMDRAPRFDRPEQFAQTRLLLADVDGSGTTDLLYAGPDGVDVYANECGNGWSAPYALRSLPRVDGAASLTTTDLLGNGTACLVWSSPLPGDARRQVRYVDLMGGSKPHLLVRVDNNLGGETRIAYAASTRFYRDDRRAGRPWPTRLPFPVHAVEQVESLDHVSRSRYVVRYRYHDGWFDGEEREFRGFGMVEQWDTEELAALGDRDVLAPAEDGEPASHVPPVLTRTWFHTGAPALSGGGFADQADPPLEAPPLPAGLSRAEEREARRALKGAVLRSELYALDGGDRSALPYTVTEQTHAVRRLQPQAGHRHAVFLSHQRESLTRHYERDPDDPRIEHKLTLAVDHFGNQREEADVGYGRRSSDATLPADADRAVQARTHIVYTTNAFTRLVTDQRNHRAPLASETASYELTGFSPAAGAARFDITLATDFAGAEEIGYEEEADPARAQRRPLDRARTLYRRDDLTSLLPLGQAGALGVSGEVYKLAFTQGLIDTLFQRPRGGGLDEALLPDPAAVLGARSGDGGGYAEGAALAADGRFPPGDPAGAWWIPSGRTFLSPDAADTAAQELAYARSHFFLPCRRQDPFGHAATETYDAYDLLVAESRDAAGNRTSAGRRDAAGAVQPGGLDYRVLRPRVVTDANGNPTAGAYDALGMLAGTAVMDASETQGDTLAGFDAELTEAERAAFAAGPVAAAPGLLVGASTRILYDLHRFRRTRAAAPGDPAAWQPVFAASLTRETHASEPGADRVQISVAYSDGLGRQVQTKAQAEPGPAVAGGPALAERWAGSGWTIRSNKGAKVREYEPFFSTTWAFEFARVEGVSAINLHDPLERVVAILHPDRSFEKVVFSAWRQTTYDVNDTCAPAGDLTGDPRTDPDVGGYVAPYFASRPPTWKTWRELRAGGALGGAEQEAAQKAAAHAGTPATVHLDPLGRPFLSSADNGVDAAGTPQVFHTRTVLDLEANQREVRDALGRVVLRFDYDMLGNRVRQTHLDAGTRWTLTDAAGEQIRLWDTLGRTIRSDHDELRRPCRSFVTGADPAAPAAELLCERIVYGESHPQAAARNLRGRLLLHLDQAGLIRSEEHDFKGNLLRTSRRFARRYATAVDWSAVDPVLPAATGDALDAAALEAAVAPRLEADTFTSRTRYDALNRAVQVVGPLGDQPGAQRNVTQYAFNLAGLLERVDVWLDVADPAGPIDAAATPPSAAGVANVDYDAAGRRTLLERANGASTRYAYDRDTQRVRSVVTGRGPTYTGDVQSLHYTYDPAGNVTRLRDDAQQAVFFRNRLVDAGADFTYDPTYRLTDATGREHLGQVGGAPIPHSAGDGRRTGIAWSANDGDAMARYHERYEYDAVANLTALRHRGTDPAHAGWSQTYAYGAGNRLASTTINGQGAEPYAHDDHGNLVRMPHLAAGADNLHWDHLDRLRRADLGTAGTAYNVFDAAGQRVRTVWERAAGVVEERFYVGATEVFRRRDAAGLQLERQTLLVAAGRQRVAIVESRTVAVAPDADDPLRLVRHQIANHLDSVGIELDHEGRIVSYEEFSPYGATTYQAVRSQTAPAKRYRYTGQERDEATGFNYHGARFYAPWLGRWLSTDPDVRELIGASAYAYARANPVVLDDPGGRQPFEEDFLPDTGGVQVAGFAKRSIEPLSNTPTSPGRVLYWTRFIAEEGHPHGSANVPSEFTLTSRIFKGTGSTDVRISTTGSLHGLNVAERIRGDHFRQFSATVGRPTGFSLTVVHPTTTEQMSRNVPWNQTAMGRHVEGAANRVGLTTASATVNYIPELKGMSPHGAAAVQGTFRAMTTGQRIVSAVRITVGDTINTARAIGRDVVARPRSWGGAAAGAFIPGVNELKAIGAGGSAVAGAQYLLTTHIPYAAGAATASVVTATTTAFAAPTLGAIAAGGAGAVGVAGTAVVAAGAAGYAVGSVINKYVAEPLIDKAAPGSGPVGDWYYRTFLK